jgi:hypothetical protein
VLSHPARAILAFKAGFDAFDTIDQHTIDAYNANSYNDINNEYEFNNPDTILDGEDDETEASSNPIDRTPIGDSDEYDDDDDMDFGYGYDEEESFDAFAKKLEGQSPSGQRNKQPAQANVSKYSSALLLESPLLLNALGGVCSFDTLLHFNQTQDACLRKKAHVQSKAPSHCQSDWLELLSVMSDHVSQENVLTQAGITPQELEAHKRIVAVTKHPESILEHKMLSIQEQTQISAHIPNKTQVHSVTECAVAAAYYFPLSQYIVSHFHELDTGLGHLESVSIDEHDDRNFLGHGGESDDLQVRLN